MALVVTRRRLRRCRSPSGRSAGMRGPLRGRSGCNGSAWRVFRRLRVHPRPARRIRRRRVLEFQLSALPSRGAVCRLPTFTGNLVGTGGARRRMIRAVSARCRRLPRWRYRTPRTLGWFRHSHGQAPAFGYGLNVAKHLVPICRFGPSPGVDQRRRRLRTVPSWVLEGCLCSGTGQAMNGT